MYDEEPPPEIQAQDRRDRVKERERRVQDVSYEDMEAIRREGMGAMVLRRPSDDQQLAPPRRSTWDDRYNPDPYAYRQRVRRERYADDRDRPPQRRRSTANHHRSRRRDQSSSSDSDSSHSRHRRRGHRRHESQPYRPRESRDRDRNQRTDDEDGEGRLWYSMKSRKDGNILERTFDSSYDGLFAAAAGAAIGAMTARHFREKIPGCSNLENPHGKSSLDPKEEKMKKRLALVGGAVVGAAGFNAAENRFRVFTEDRVERGKDDMEIAPAMELAGEVTNAIPMGM